MHDQQLTLPNENLFGTGGGVLKYGKLLKKHFRLNIRHYDELKCLLRGLNFLLTNINDECYYMDDQESKQPSDHIPISINTESTFPYIFVNIGSGVSILKIESKRNFERVSGSQLGGGTFWGLCKLFVDGNISYKTAFELCSDGNTENINMLVRDIYGGDYSQFELSGDIVASAFGKCGFMQDGELKGVDKRDVAKGLLDMHTQ